MTGTVTKRSVGAPRRIAIAIAPGFDILNAAGPFSAFQFATALYGADYQVEMISLNGGNVVGAFGAELGSKKASSQLNPDTVIVVGGPSSPQEGANVEAVKLIQLLAPGARRISSACTGAFALAEAGLLDNKHVTTHWRFAASLQKRFPAVKVDANRIYVKDGSLWTSGGMTAGIDLALAMIEEDCGVKTAKAISHSLVVQYRRSGGQTQFSSVIRDEMPAGRARDALAVAKERLHEDISVDVLADVVGLSTRQFQRLFAAEMGETPARAIERLRVEAARPKVEAGQESLGEIAQGVGFGDVNRMRRSFIKIFGRSPQDIRRAGRLG